jgi:hypothetical protein
MLQIVMDKLEIQRLVICIRAALQPAWPVRSRQISLTPEYLVIM